MRLFFRAFVCSLLVWPAAAQAADADIRLSSIGYLPERVKRASIVASATTFSVVNDTSGLSVLSGSVTGPVTAADTGDSVWTADFSSVTAPGTYHLEVAGVGRSVSFPIDAEAYRAAFQTSMLGFYGWRCGTAVSFDYQGTHFGYPACHQADADGSLIGGSGTRDGTGGWHDAGDYGKYTVNTALTLGSLLAAWEEYRPALELVRLQIPETGGALPDYLAEVKWELEWLLKMQYSPTDGRVAHKLTAHVHPPFIMPQDDLPTTTDNTRFFVPFGTGATADFAAALAKAARIYQPYDAAFADRCLTAAQLSFAYLQANPANVAPNETGFIGTQYTSSDADDRLWAAAELWETTGDAAALTSFEALADALPDTAMNPRVSPDFDWGNLKNLGIYVYLASARSGKSTSTVNALRQSLLAAADSLVANRDANAWGRDLTSHYWGVHGSVARSCMLLQVANRLAPKAAYLDTCSEQLGYLFGRNTWNRSQVTGLGLNPPLHIHHRPSSADGIDAPYPGLLVGGPWAYKALTFSNGDPTIPACTLPAGACWNDVEANYQINEVAINWNAALTYALAGFVTTNAPPPPDAGADGGAAGTGGAAGSGTSGGNSASGAAGVGNAGAAGAGTGGAGAAGSASTPPAAAARSSNQGGCGCRTASDTPAAPGWFGLSALAAALLVRRRARAA